MRKARVLLVALHNPADPDQEVEHRVETNLSNILTLLDEAEAYDPDVVCFPETTLQHGSIRDGIVADVAQTVPGPATDAVAEKARELDCYVGFGMFERDGDDLYNAFPFVGPDGSVVGTYRKLAPILAGMEQGIRPGDSIPVWETEFGRIGACICWDARYPEIGSRLGRAGVDLVLRPTLGSEHRQLGTWALYNGFHVANCDKNGARFYDPTGADFAGAVDAWNTPEVEHAALDGGTAFVSFSELNTDFGTYMRRPWIQEALEEHAGSIVCHEAVDDGMLVLESIDPDLPLSGVERAYSGETIAAYRERTRNRILDENALSPLADPRELT